MIPFEKPETSEKQMGATGGGEVREPWGKQGSQLTVLEKAEKQWDPGSR